MALMRRRSESIAGISSGRITGLIWRDDAGDGNGIRESSTDPGDPPFALLGDALNAAGDVTALRAATSAANANLGTPTP